MKAAIGMIHAGIGEVHVNNLLTTLGIPPIHHKTLKRMERSIGTVMEKTARDSCASACRGEKDALIHLQEKSPIHDEQLSFNEAMDFVEAEEVVVRTEVSPDMLTSECETPQIDIGIVVSQDAAWTKRGRGMNSLSGWGHVIGERTKKCLNFSTRLKNCAKCTFYDRTGERAPLHDCRKNWSGSAKSMEPDITTELHKRAHQMGLMFIGVIGDEDSSSIKYIREKVYKVYKFSDFGHVKRTLRGKLEKLHKQHKTMSVKVQDSFLKNFSYAVKQNKSKSEDKMRNSLKSIVPHMYGEHERCGDW